MEKKNVRLKNDDEAAVRREFVRLRKRLAEFDHVDRETRRERGLKKLTEIVGVRGGKVLNELIEFSPELVRFIVDHAYGDVISRERLDGRARALVVIAALAAMGNAAPELKTHVGTALNSGCTREDVLETMLLVGVYAGFPAAMNGMGIAREVMAARGVKRVRANVVGGEVGGKRGR
jgi:4-carboxymuconolactone decarboxylase